MIFETNNRHDEWCGRYSRFVIYNVPANVMLSVARSVLLRIREIAAADLIASSRNANRKELIVCVCARAKDKNSELQIASKLSRQSVNCLWWIWVEEIGSDNRLWAQHTTEMSRRYHCFVRLFVRRCHVF